MTTVPALRARIKAGLWTPWDAAGLAAFRVLFGLVACVGSLRFLYRGWIEPFFLDPPYQFHYWGFDWVSVGPAWVMYGLFIVMAVTSLCVALGLFYRVAIITFFLVFTYVELLDVTYYLNHYYLVSVLAFLLCWLPLGRVYSLDNRRRPERALTHLPGWMTWMLRLQVGLVYVYASVAKMTADWVVHAQPLGLWLASRTDTPLIGAFLGEPWVAYAMSWAGLLYDLSIPLLLLWAPTRVPAYGVLVVFHAGVGLLFNIGMFPVIMVTVATIFFAPGWPRRCLRGRWLASVAEPRPLTAPAASSWRRRAGVLVLSGFMAVQVLLPARASLYDGNVLWHEQGMRWSWRVLCREKNGTVSYRVRPVGSTRERVVSPSRFLTDTQEREMSAQPDLILQLAHHIADTYAQRGQRVEVRADAFASLNGRRRARLIDPDVDLTTVRDGLAPAHWILPAPEGPPFKSQPIHRSWSPPEVSP